MHLQTSSSVEHTIKSSIQFSKCEPQFFYLMRMEIHRTNPTTNYHKQAGNETKIRQKLSKKYTCNKLARWQLNNCLNCRLMSLPILNKLTLPPPPQGTTTNKSNNNHNIYIYKKTNPKNIHLSENTADNEPTSQRSKKQYLRHPKQHRWLANDDLSSSELSLRYSNSKQAPSCPFHQTQSHLLQSPGSAESMPMVPQNSNALTEFSMIRTCVCRSGLVPNTSPFYPSTTSLFPHFRKHKYREPEKLVN